ncbi:MAG: MBL fold metallo-hydrolase, partial [Spirochaetes bacterium]|nr:MBL fold metallo-hydrolase [Spirochaetota bacterium]
MKVKILGNGGAINQGLYYNAFIIDDHILCETPPDIMYTLSRQNIAIKQIDTIFLSHYHGDHCFGLPFLVLNLFVQQIKKNIQIIGPSGLKEHCEKLVELAFTNDHPCYQWLNENFVFTEIEQDKCSIQDYSFLF